MKPFCGISSRASALKPLRLHSRTRIRAAPSSRRAWLSSRHCAKETVEPHATTTPTMTRATTAPPSSRQPSEPLSKNLGLTQSSALATLQTVARASRSGARSLVGKYNTAQSRRPNWTQLVCTLVIWFVGDVSAQIVVLSGREGEGVGKGEQDGTGEAAGDGVKMEEEKARYDIVRTIRHMTVGGICSIPSFKWFMFLHNHFNFSSRPLSILAKVTINQLIFTPIFNTYFFTAHSLLSLSASLPDTLNRVITAVPVSVKNSLLVWPAVTAVNFWYVPVQFRNLFAGVVAVGWQTYLSWLNQKAAREVQAAKDESHAEGVRGGVAVPAGAAVAA